MPPPALLLAVLLLALAAAGGAPADQVSLEDNDIPALEELVLQDLQVSHLLGLVGLRCCRLL